jgi:16S rRNA (cytidine1402-2'-O)-methyltransferase
MGVLFVVGTPIGNLEDVSQRALRVLREVHLIAAEDTRTTAKLLARYDISTPMLSFFEHNKVVRQREILRVLGSHDVALVSEAGVPTISDPGYRLVRACIENNIEVVPIPGPSAVIAALCVSGLPTDSFVFQGYLPRRKTARRRLLENLRTERRTIVFFEAPHRLSEAVEDMEQVLGDRSVVIASELTKRFEQVWRGSLAAASAHLRENPPRGEYTLVLEGAPGSDEQPWSEDRVLQALDDALASGLSRRDAAARVAAESRWRRKVIYSLAASRPAQVKEDVIANGRH